MKGTNIIIQDSNSTIDIFIYSNFIHH